MSDHLAAKYMRSSRKRIKEQQPDEAPKKQPKTDAERARCYRARMRMAKDDAASSAAWDAGEGTSRQGREFACYSDYTA